MSHSYSFEAALDDANKVIDEPSSDASNKKWQWIERNIQAKIDNWAENAGAVILVRGHRRVGKTSSVVRAAKNYAQKHSIESDSMGVPKNLRILLVDVVDSVVVDNARSLFGVPIAGIFDVGLQIAVQIRDGNIVVIKEIQNASSSFQISLQRGIDFIAQMSMFDSDSWQKAGTLFLMGSIPGIVDAMVESNQSAIYRRVSGKVTVFPFNTVELIRLFRAFDLLSNPSSLPNQLKVSFYPFFNSCVSCLICDSLE